LGNVIANTDAAYILRQQLVVYAAGKWHQDSGLYFTLTLLRLHSGLTLITMINRKERTSGFKVFNNKKSISETRIEFVLK